MNYFLTVGLEIHAELKTKTKMFCSCLNDPQERRPNTNICPVCMGHPGTLPVANKEAILSVVKTGLSVNCEIAEKSKFDRKNYFYPDLPKGYQISQYDMPLCKGGFLAVNGKKIRITRIHIEEDTGRSQHPEGTDYSLVDCNRAGVPLMELVTEPDITDEEDASMFAKEFQLILRYLDVSDADMDRGQMRVEANISVRKEEGDALGTKVEVKNLNSFRAVERAIAYEYKRQVGVLEGGGKIVQETRGWNDGKQETFSQREKEEAHDYRYFPEPDLPLIVITKEDVAKIKGEIPELPQFRIERFQREYELSAKEALLCAERKELGEYFEKTVSELGPHLEKGELKNLIRLAANYLFSDVQGVLQAGGMSIESPSFQMTPENFAELVVLIAKGEVNSASAKALLPDLISTGSDPSSLIESRGLRQVTDRGAIEEYAREILKQNPKAIEDYKKGKQQSLQFLIGKMMTATRGTISPEIAREVLISQMEA